MIPSGPWRRLVGVLAVTAVAFVGAACGDIPLDDAPRVIDPEEIPEGLVGPATSVPLDGEERDGVNADLFLFFGSGLDEVLVPCAVPTAAGGSVEARARAVIEQLINLDPATSDLCPDSLTNAVPPDLAVLSVRLVVEERGNVLDLNLERQALANIEATQQRRAIAQLVFTATDVPGVSAVRFFADGTAISVPVEDRTADPGEAITPEDFTDLDAASDLLETFSSLVEEPSTTVAPVP